MTMSLSPVAFGKISQKTSRDYQKIRRHENQRLREGIVEILTGGVSGKSPIPQTETGLKTRFLTVYQVASHDLLERLRAQVRHAMRRDGSYKPVWEYLRGLQRAAREAASFDVPIALLASPAAPDVRKRGKRVFARVH